MSPKLHHALLKLWHAWIAGAFLVAWLTADEDTYAMHLFAGYAVLAAIAARLLAGLAAGPSSPLKIRRPSLAAMRAWLSSGKGRNPLFAWLAVALLATVGLSAVSGVLADGMAWLEDPHEAAAQAALWVIVAHIAFVLFIYGGKRLLGRISARLSGLRSPTTSQETV